MTENAGHDALIEEIQNDASKKADRIVRKAEREAAEIREKAKREADAIRAEMSQGAQKKAEAEKNVILATIAVDAKRIEMDVKELPVSQAFDAAGEKLERREFDYPESAARLIAAAARELGDEELRVALCEKDFETLDQAALAEGVTQLLEKPVQLQFEHDASISSGGVVVKSEDGRRICDNTYTARMRRLRDDIRRDAAKIILEL